MSEQVYISLGSNIEPAKWIPRALAQLRRQFGPLQLSPLYESRAHGFEGDAFINMVIGVDTEMRPAELSECLAEIEKSCQRQRSEARFSARTMDLDLICYGAVDGEVEGIRLPREEVLNCDFVLRPLADLAPDESHPGLGRSWAELWRAYQRSPVIDSKLSQLSLSVLLGSVQQGLSVIEGEQLVGDTGQ